MSAKIAHDAGVMPPTATLGWENCPTQPLDQPLPRDRRDLVDDRAPGVADVSGTCPLLYPRPILPIPPREEED